MISVTTSGGGLEALISRLQKFNKDELEHQIAEIIVNDIKENTAAHHSPDGSMFKPYTPAYAKKRAKMGLTTIPNLTITGTLLANLYATKDGIITTISDGDNPGKVESNQKLRPFIGVSQRTRQKIKDLVHNSLAR
ncbi:MAG TPA: hypothetical protein VII94_05675 [Candidatus Saccharimonadales bacterium]